MLEAMKIMVTSFRRCVHALLHSVPPCCSRPPQTPASAGDSWTSWTSPGQSLVGLLFSGVYGSDHKLSIAKFRLKLKKVGKTTRPFRYDLNQIPYNYTYTIYIHICIYIIYIIHILYMYIYNIYTYTYIYIHIYTHIYTCGSDK